MNPEKKPKPRPNTLLRRQRELRNFTLQDVADRLYEMGVKEGRESGISADTVGRWERGVSQPEAHYRAKLCDLFGKHTTELGLIEQERLGASSQTHAPLPTSHIPPPFDEERYHDTNLERGEPSAVQEIAVVLIPTHQPIDLLRNTSDAPSEQQLGPLLALEANELATFFDAGWSVDELLETLRVVLPGIQAMPKITRRAFGRKLLQFGTAAVISGVPIPSGRHISVEDRNKLHSALGESIAASWHLFHTAGNAQVLAVGRAQLYLIQQVHPILQTPDRSLFYSAVYDLIGKALFFQERHEEAIEAHQSAYIAALQAGDPWRVTQNLICLADGFQALGRHAEAIQTIEEASRVLGNPRDEEQIRSKAHLLACWADNAMSLGEEALAQRKLEASATYLDQLGPNEEFDRAIWLQLAGKYALLSGDYITALSHYEAALAELPPHWIVRQSLVLIPMMVAYACKRDRESSIAMANRAITTLSVLKAPGLNKQFAESLQLGLCDSFPGDQRVDAFLAEARQRYPQVMMVSHR